MLRRDNEPHHITDFHAATQQNTAKTLRRDNEPHQITDFRAATQQNTAKTLRRDHLASQSFGITIIWRRGYINKKLSNLAEFLLF